MKNFGSRRPDPGLILLLVLVLLLILLLGLLLILRLILRRLGLGILREQLCGSWRSLQGRKMEESEGDEDSQNSKHESDISSVVSI